MIIVDVNIVVYAHNAGAPKHAAAKEWARNAFSGSEPVRIPWAVVHAFLRVTAWFASPSVELIEPGPRYWSILRSLLIAGNIRGPLVSDAHLAALALEHDATLYTADRDFHRFAALRVTNPLA